MFAEEKLITATAMCLPPPLYPLVYFLSSNEDLLYL